MTENDPLPAHTLKQLLPFMTPTRRKKARALAKFEGEAELLEQGWLSTPNPDRLPGYMQVPDYMLIAYRYRDVSPDEFARATAELHADGVENFIDRWEMMAWEAADGEALKFNANLTRIVKVRS